MNSIGRNKESFIENIVLNGRIAIVLFFVIVNAIQSYMFNEETSRVVMNFMLKSIVLPVMNFKINVHGNAHYLKDSNMLVMSNHYDGLDGFAFLAIMNEPNFLHIVTKADLVGNKIDKNAISYILSFIKAALIKSLNFIPYKRGDKESGIEVKDQIVEKLRNNNANVLVFPEGTTHKYGVAKQFKSGIFHLASEENITILPITIIYDRHEFGSEFGDPVDMISWLNNTCNVYVHEKIRGNNWSELKDKTFEAINEGYNKNKQ